MVLSAGVEAAADLYVQIFNRFVEVVVILGKPFPQLARQAARGGDPEFAGVGAGAGGHVDHRAGAAAVQPQFPQLAVKRGEVRLADPAEDDVLLDRRSHRVLDVTAADVGQAPQLVWR